MGHYLTDTESKAMSEELARVRNDRNDKFVELTRLREENARLREALNKIADYSPGSTVQPALIAREAIKVPS